MGGMSLRNFSDASAGGDVFYNGGVPYDSQGRLLIDSSLNIQKPAMVTVAVGNSISAQSKYGGFNTWWVTKGELHIANALARGAMRFKRMTASTRADQWGVYGYSGQTISTILGDVGAQLYTPLQTAGIVPDMVVGLALAENDIAAGTAAATINANILTFVRDVKARYPGAIVWLCTPRPSFSYDSAAKVAIYQSVRDYTLALDNGYDVFVSRLDGYENPSSPGTPLGTAASPIYTDNTVHPNGKGAMVNARVMADTLLRIAPSFQHPYRALSNNMALSGTGAASGTNVSGTVPTSATITGSANGTYVSLAEQPGHLVTITANASGVEPPVDLSTQNYGSVTYAGGANAQISAFAEIEIVSGAENIGWLQMSPRYAGSGGGNVFMEFIKRNTNDVDPVFNNGDIFLFRTPPIMAADVTGLTGNISGVTPYLRAWSTINGGTFAFRVLSQGIEVVVEEAGSVGEYVSSTVATGSSVSLTTNTTANITSISLTPGDWDVTGVVDFTFGATTSYTNLQGGVSTTSATIGGQDSYFDFETAATVPTATKDPAFTVPTVRLTLTSTTTVYLVAQATFTVSTLKAYGTLRARRVK